MLRTGVEKEHDLFEELNEVQHGQSVEQELRNSRR